MSKKEEVFLLYNKLNILLDKEQKALEREDIEEAFSLLERENDIIQKIDNIPKEDYVTDEKDKKAFIRIISFCLKKREENEKLLENLKKELMENINQIEYSKKAVDSYFRKEKIAPKFIDKIK